MHKISAESASDDRNSIIFILHCSVALSGLDFVFYRNPGLRLGCADAITLGLMGSSLSGS